MNRLLLLSIFVLLIPNISAQTSPLPSVSIECEDGPHDINTKSVSTGSTIVSCTVSNDTLFSETIEFSVSSDVLSYSVPESVNLDPGSEEEIEITIRATRSHFSQSR